MAAHGKGVLLLTVSLKRRDALPAEALLAPFPSATTTTWIALPGYGWID